MVNGAGDTVNAVGVRPTRQRGQTPREAQRPVNQHSFHRRPADRMETT